MNIKDTKGVDVQRDIQNELAPEPGLYQYLLSVDKNDAVVYLGIIVGVAFLMRHFNVSTNLMAAVLVGFVIVYILNENKRVTLGDSAKDLLFKIETLDILTETKHLYLYTEPRLINFFAENVDFRKYAEDAFDRSLIEVDLFLKLKYDIEIGTQKCSADLDVMEGLRRTILNRFYEIDFNLPNAETVRQKLYAALAKLSFVLIDLMAETKSVCKDKPFNEFYVTPPVGAPDDYDADAAESHLLYT